MTNDSDQLRLFQPGKSRTEYAAQPFPLYEVPLTRTGPLPTRNPPAQHGHSFMYDRRTGDYTPDVGHFRQAPDEEQLRMFMRPHEILEKWGPLDGDREERWTDGPYDSPDTRRGTWSTENTHGYANHENSNHVQGASSQRPGGTAPYLRSGTGDTETDDQLWERKYREAYDPYGRQGAEGWELGGERSRITASPFDTKGRPNEPGYVDEVERTRRTTGGNTIRDSRGYPSYTYQEQPAYRRPGEAERKFHGEDSLGDSIARYGYQGSPISLGFTRNMNGQREIVGGHHRMAVMKEDRPNDYVPVQHFKDIREAQIKYGDTYT